MIPRVEQGYVQARVQNKNLNLVGLVQKMLPCIQSLHSKYIVNVANQNES